jgi:hypothetical protein
MFWKMGGRLFGAKVVHFMSEYMNEGEYFQGLSTSRTLKSSVVNFVVPDLSIPRNSDPYGVYEDVVVVLHENLSVLEICLSRI